MTPQEALDRIAARVSEAEENGSHAASDLGVLDALVDAVRAVLAEVTPEPGGTLDREHAILAAHDARMRWTGGSDYDYDAAIVDAVLAIVRPVAGVTLTPEEAAYARRWLPMANSQRARDLAARLEATR